MEYQAHIDELAKELGSAVVQHPNMPGMMYVEYKPPLVTGPIIQKQKDYLILLHELGHVFHKHTQGRPPFQDKRFYFDNGVLLSEAQAWEWALDQSMEEPDPNTKIFMWDTCLGSYYRSAKKLNGKSTRLTNGNRHYVEFVFDAPDKYFWSIKRRMLKG